MARNKRNSRGRKRTACDNNGKQRMHDRSWREDESQSARNDISWYSRNPNLLIAAGSFPFPNRPGMEITFTKPYITPGTTDTVGKAFSFRIPGVMALDWMPSVGVSTSATDPASILAKEIYAKVRSQFSGNLDADAPDFVIYIMALDSLFSYLAWLKRVYRVMNSWTPENYVLPDVLLSSMGLTEADILNLRQERMRFWQIINELVLQSRKFTCPAVMDIFNRHYWMSDNVYTDAAQINSQFYLFNLRSVYKFAMLDMPDGNPGPGLQMTNLPTVRASASQDSLTPKDFYDFGRQLIDALVAWDDAYTINGYLLRAYQGVPNFVVDELPADQPFNPVYEEEVLAQIENSRTLVSGEFMPSDLAGCNFNVTQDVLSNAVISQPQYTAMGFMLGDQLQACLSIPPYLSIRSTTPTVADNTIASRLHANVKFVSEVENTKFTANVDAGTEIPVRWRYVDGVYKNPGAIFNGSAGLSDPAAVSFEQVRLFNVGGGNDTITTTNADTMMVFMMRQLQVAQFDWHPFSIILYNKKKNAASGSYYLSVCGDIHNFTTISADDLENLHKICIYSELNAFSA